MKTDTLDKILTASGLIILGILVWYYSWWWPQKWEVCADHYHNRPAQIVCMFDR